MIEGLDDSWKVRC